MENIVSGRGSGFPWRLLGWGTAAALLLLPLVAMQFTSEVNWTPADFVFAAVMFALVGGTLELAVRKSGNLFYRGGVAVAVAATFLLVWINGAVGIIGDEGNPANLMFFGVIAVALVGAIVARFQPDGMARAMFLAALAEMLVAVIALVGRLGANEPPGMAGVLVLIGFFAVMWAASGLLFLKAARGARQP
jgi:hypothetical protein